MKTNVKISLSTLLLVSLITLGTYIVQAEEVVVLPPEPIIEVAEIIPPAPELLETEINLLLNETITDLVTSTPYAPLDIEVTESTDEIDDNELIPADVVIEEAILESEITVEENFDLETAEVSESVAIQEDAIVLPYSKFPNFLEETSVDRLPTMIQDCLGGGFRDFTRPFAHPGECLQYVRAF